MKLIYVIVIIINISSIAMFIRLNDFIIFGYNNIIINKLKDKNKIIIKYRNNLIHIIIFKNCHYLLSTKKP